MKKWIFLATLLAAMLTGAYVYNWIANIGNPVVETVSNVATAVAEATLPPEPVTVTEQAMVEVIDQKLELTVSELNFRTSVTTGVCNDVIWNDCLTMIVPGKVEVDLLLDDFGVENIEATNDIVTIRLPGVTVGDVVPGTIPENSIIYEQGYFVFDSNPNLQGQGLAEARVNLREQACRSSLLVAVNHRTARRVKNLLQPLFSSVNDPRTINVVLEEPWC